MANDPLMEMIEEFMKGLRERYKDEPAILLDEHLKIHDPLARRTLTLLANGAMTGDRTAELALRLVEAAFKAGEVRGRVMEVKRQEEAAAPPPQNPK